MSMFICVCCDQIRDSDDGAEELGRGLVCVDCLDDLDRDDLDDGDDADLESWLGDQ